MTKRPILILGGNSDIGLAIAHRFAQEGYPIQLAARSLDELEAEQSNISLRHNVAVTLHLFDALEIDRIEAFYDGLPSMPGIVVCAVGLLGDQAEAERNPQLARLLAETNFIGPTVALEAAARRLSRLDGATAIIGISSVAGDRGRAINYWYGASKAAFSEALSGIRQKYAPDHVHVMTVKLGFVATKMTHGLDLPKFLTASPDQISELIYKKYISKSHNVYPFVWRCIMLLITNIPERIFKKMKF